MLLGREGRVRQTTPINSVIVRLTIPLYGKHAAVTGSTDAVAGNIGDVTAYRFLQLSETFWSSLDQGPRS